MIPAIVGAYGVELVAIGSESNRGREFVGALQDEVRVCSYAHLLADAEVEAVYIPLPNHLHAEWSMRAAAPPRPDGRWISFIRQVGGSLMGTARQRQRP